MHNKRFANALSFALGLSALAALPALVEAGSVAVITSINGNVSVRRGITGVEPAENGQSLGQGHTVITQANSSAVILFDNGATATVAADSRLTIKRYTSTAPGGPGANVADLANEPGTSRTRLSLDYGQVIGSVKTLNAGSRFDVDTPIGSAGIRGTTFVVDAEKLAGGGWRVTVGIDEGSGTFDATGRGQTQILTKKQIVITKTGDQIDFSPLADLDPALAQAIQNAVQLAITSLRTVIFKIGPGELPELDFPIVPEASPLSPIQGEQESSQHQSPTDNQEG